MAKWVKNSKLKLTKGIQSVRLAVAKFRKMKIMKGIQSARPAKASCEVKSMELG